MFQPIITRLSSVRRFDIASSSKEMEVGEVETVGGGTALAVQVAGQALTLEPRAQSQLLSQWSIPGDHFDRLPRELQAAELNHFRVKAPKDLTVRAVQNGHPTPSARAFVSGKYEAFDTTEALMVAQASLTGEWAVAEDKVERDEARVLIVQPQEHDVSARRTGDLVKLGLSIRNSEVGTGALGVEFCTFRLVCLNGMIAQQAAVSVKQRHIWIDKQSFRIQLKNAVQNVAEIGQAIIQQMRASHDLLLPNLDPDADNLRRKVFGILRRHGMGTKDFLAQAEQALGREEEASVFGLAQFITNGYAKRQPTVMQRLGVERVAGELMALAAV